jgi:hypothetical protein
MVARGCYQMVIIATGKDMMSPKTVATEGHNSDRRFDDITDEPLYKRVTGCPLLKSDLHPVTTEALCSIVYGCSLNVFLTLSVIADANIDH